MAKNSNPHDSAVGDGLAVRIPAAVCVFRIRQQVEATNDGIKMTAKRVDPRKLTLVEKLATFDPLQHGGEAMSTRRVGAE